MYHKVQGCRFGTSNGIHRGNFRGTCTFQATEPKKINRRYVLFQNWYMYLLGVEKIQGMPMKQDNGVLFKFSEEHPILFIQRYPHGFSFYDFSDLVYTITNSIFQVIVLVWKLRVSWLVHSCMEFGMGKNWINVFCRIAFWCKIGQMKSSYLGLKQGKGFRKCATHLPPSKSSSPPVYIQAQARFPAILGVQYYPPNIVWGKESASQRCLTKWLEVALSLIRARTAQIASITGRSLVVKMTSCLFYDLYMYIQH